MQKKIRNTQKYKSIPQSAEAVRTRYIKKSVGTKSAVLLKKSAQNRQYHLQNRQSIRPSRRRGQGHGKTNKRSVA